MTTERAKPYPPGGGPYWRRPRPWTNRLSEEWAVMRENMDMFLAAQAVLGQPPGRKGESAGKRYWWVCPFHPDKNPSLCVDAASKRYWRCYGCGEHGDAVALVMKVRGFSFREAVDFLMTSCHLRVATLGSAHGSWRRRSPKPLPKVEAPTPPDPVEVERHREWIKEVATKALTDLWADPAAGEALDFLRGRGLLDTTIAKARLGWAPEVWPTRFQGITIPWVGRDGLELLKVRQPEGARPKYAEVYRRRPTIFPRPLSPTSLARPLIVVEGEFDALLIGQILGDAATVFTTGSASSRPAPDVLREVETACRLFLAHDADEAGDRAAGHWPKRGVRVRPPADHKDWSDAHGAGADLLAFWTTQGL